MENETIGLLEEMLLLIVIKYEDISGSSVLQNYNEIFGRSISLPAVISTLKRLERKGFLITKMGEATAQRGGKRKKLYSTTNQGIEIATSIQKSRELLWEGLVNRRTRTMLT